MSTSPSYVDGSARPYVNRDEFDQIYPVSYKPYVGIVDNSTGQPISNGIPTLSDSKPVGSGAFSSRRGLGIKAMVSRPSANSFKKNVYSDLEMKEYLDWNNLRQLLKSLFQSFVASYLQLIFSQPFEVARNLLQVGSFRRSNTLSGSHSAQGSSVPPPSQQTAHEDADDDDDDDDEPEPHYFEKDSQALVNGPRHTEIERPASVSASSSSPAPQANRGTSNSTGSGNASQLALAPALISPRSMNMMDTISAIVGREGPRGAFKAINTSFMLNTLQYTLQSWISGFVSGLLNIPDPLFVEISHSPNPNMSMGLQIVSYVATALFLSTIALIRMRFIVTTSTRGVRSFRTIVSKMPRFSLFKVPRELVMPSLVTNLVRAVTYYYPDYYLTAVMQISRYNQPYVYNAMSLGLRIVGMFIRLPFETLYSRAQVNTLLSSPTIAPVLRADPNDLCVNFGGYWGYLQTLYYILAGTKPVNYGQNIGLEIEDRDEANKGPAAIFRGWKVGLVQMVSKFALNLLANEADSNSLEEEQL